jgi:uncharacterized membrane protein
LPEFAQSRAIEAVAVEISDFLFTGLFHVLSSMFVIGLLGCILVIPITAYRLFSVLFQKDQADDQ